MFFKPLKNHFQSSSWHFTFYYAIFDIHNGFKISVPCMEMWWLMIGEIHPYIYSIEETYLWHNCILYFCSAANLSIISEKTKKKVKIFRFPPYYIYNDVATCA